MRILIVDDEADLLRVLAQFLASRGHEIATAATGSEARTAFRTGAPDLVLLDAVLPGVHDLNLLAEFLLASPHVPVVIVSGSLEIDDKEARSRGAYAFLQKPFDLRHLIEIIDHIPSRADRS